MSKATRVVPSELAILPVRDTVLFPGAVMPLPVGRESSLALLDSLEGPEKLLGVVAQLDPRVESPTGTDIHTVGTLAKVHKMVRMPNGNVVAFLEGLGSHPCARSSRLDAIYESARGRAARSRKSEGTGIDGA